jgi:hypothetical protein
LRLLDDEDGVSRRITFSDCLRFLWLFFIFKSGLFTLRKLFRTGPQAFQLTFESLRGKAEKMSKLFFKFTSNRYFLKSATQQYVRNCNVE